MREFWELDRKIIAGQKSSTNELDANYLQGRPGADTTLRLLNGTGWTNNVVLGEESIQREYGTFTCNDTKLSFVVDVPDFEASGWAPLHIVRWGSRVYLINEERLADFEDAIQRGFEPRTTRHGLFYLREGDQTKPVSGDPIWPEGESDSKTNALHDDGICYAWRTECGKMLTTDGED